MPFHINSEIYVMETDFLGKWVTGRILEIQGESAEMIFKIEMNNCMSSTFRTGKQIADGKPSEMQLQFGKRVIAMYKPDNDSEQPEMYAGIVAEPLTSTNNYRYLIFFDSGKAQYVEHDSVRLVSKESSQVWNDVHPSVMEFTKTYIQQFPNNPTLQLQEGQAVMVQFNTNWSHAKVIAVDGNVVKLHFEAEKKFESIYKGSTSLQLLHEDNNSIIQQSNIKEPYVEDRMDTDQVVQNSDEVLSEETTSSGKRSAVWDSAAQIEVKKPSLAVEGTSESEHRKEGKMHFLEPPCVLMLNYGKHRCGFLCIYDNNFPKRKEISRLCVPMYLGFQRCIMDHYYHRSRLTVCYRAPCGKSLRNLDEMVQHLIAIKSSLTIDMFTYDPRVFPFQYFQVTKEQVMWSTDDIAEGKENIPVPCVNCWTDEKLPCFEYITESVPGQNVTLNMDKEFLCCCDCTDNCQDRLKCQCQLLTMQAWSRDGSATDAGYNYGRLKEKIITGLYECNSRCSCNSLCVNRVAQNGLQIRLQVFKKKKSWGVRCMDDVDAGTFVCTLVGEILTEQEANEAEAQYDEYFTELDLIEVAEKYKEGYESDVDDQEEVETDSDSSSSFTSRRQAEEKKINAGLQDMATGSTEELPMIVDLEKADGCSQDAEMCNSPTSMQVDPPFKESKPNLLKSVRSYFDETIYILYSRHKRNIGQFLNHSCSPNCFVQNVFIGMHDLRFPTIAFFTNNYIRAGTELTWDYNYEVGSVNGKVWPCHCESKFCRGRLL